MQRQLFDPYAVLGLPPTATKDEITNAYRRQVRALHPDTRTTAQPGADELLERVLAAYELLRDPERRAHYDRVANRRSTTQRATAERTNTTNLTGAVRILGVTFKFKVGPVSE